ncbi:hypothetical protein ElyMa_001187500 [Elysia marginata]|uniref:Uncharacterized protein n=1 Tax=Elysia marginata TaxID=1093978 RepID=A0AAV4I5U0_9GAST|nr:hypothetical protein ElyMa_001187500 [Elysia marginata]
MFLRHTLSSSARKVSSVAWERTEDWDIRFYANEDDNDNGSYSVCTLQLSNYLKINFRPRVAEVRPRGAVSGLTSFVCKIQKLNSPVNSSVGEIVYSNNYFAKCKLKNSPLPKGNYS